MRLFNFLNKPPSLAIAAIFRNEKEYILEWLAWHISQGIQHFIIYDNQSDDGTTELLQQLQLAQLINLHNISRQEDAQRIAYNQIFKDYKNKFDLIAVIDADEFIMPIGVKSASEEIYQTFQDSQIGALAINWRIFGSNKHKIKPNGLVLQSYTMAANDQRLLNHYIKSVYRTKATTQFNVHMGLLKKGYRYINTLGDDVIFSTRSTFPQPTENNRKTGVSQTISAKRLRINHYAVKSSEEFVNKKKNKGRSAGNKDDILSDAYFQRFNLNDEEILIPKKHYDAFKKEYMKLKECLSKSTI